jgi:hypothetical protein
MKTILKPEVKEAMKDAEDTAPHLPSGLETFYYLGVALVLAVCEIADAVNQIVADLPSHDS